MHQLKSHIATALAAFALTACTACTGAGGTLYSQFVDISPSGWAEDEQCEYNVPTLDSLTQGYPAGTYTLVLAVRHTDALPYAELRLRLFQDQLHRLPLPDTLSVPVAAPGGAWRGSYSKGIYTLTDTLLRAVPAAAIPDTLGLRLAPAMSVPSFPGLLSVGLILTR